MGDKVATVREVMSTQLVTVDTSAYVAEAARAMSNGGSGSALVLEEGTLVGILTERDIMRALAESAKADLARVSSVSLWMTRDPVTIGFDATVGEALDLMLSHGFRHLPVMKGDDLVGVVSMRDLATSIARH